VDAGAPAEPGGLKRANSFAMKTAPRGLIVLRADGGAGVGAGHVSRCLALQDWLRVDGWRAQIAVNAEAVPFVPPGFDPDNVVLVAPGSASSADMVARWPDGCDVLVLDHYGIGREVETELKGWARRVAVIDDIPNRPHRCDLIVDQTAGRQSA